MPVAIRHARLGLPRRIARVLEDWAAAVLAMLITLALVVGELTDAGQRHWWAGRPLTTDTVAGLLV